MQNSRLTNEHSLDRVLVVFDIESVECDWDESPAEEDDWFCIKMKMTCGCGREFKYVQVAHKVIVWPDNDDPHLLRMCHALQERGFNPRVKPYNESMGSCVSWYAINVRELVPCE